MEEEEEDYAVAGIWEESMYRNNDTLPIYVR
jgi:hypothetical protein